MAKKRLLLPENNSLTTKRSTTTVAPVPITKGVIGKDTREYYDWLKSKKLPVQANVIEGMRKENGSPQIKMISGRSEYNSSTNTMSIDTSGNWGGMKNPKTGLSVTSDPVQSTISEMSHARQYQDAPIASKLKSWKDKFINGVIKGDRELSYKDPNSLEYQAHSIIQPKLGQQFHAREFLQERADEVLNNYSSPLNKITNGPTTIGGKIRAKQAVAPIQYKLGGEMKQPKKKMALGGYPTQNFDYLKNIKGLQDPKFTGAPQLPESPSSSGNTAGAVQGAAALLNTGVNAIAPADKYGVKSGGAAAASGALSGAATGAAIGSAVPGIGTAIGAVAGGVIGGVSGVIGNNKAKKKKEIAVGASIREQLAANSQRSQALLAANPELAYGKQDASYYRLGGTMKGTGVTPPRMKRPMAKIQGAQDLLPNVASVPGRQLSRKAAGGMIKPISSEDAKVTGASHDNGGVKLPELGVEVEGGETINNGFVFSKELGFAQKQEKVAKSLGKVEKMPDTVINRNTANALKRKTELLKNQQETVKAAMGIPNDLEQKAMGGMLEEGDKPGVPKKKVPLVDKTSPTYNPALLTDGKFLVDKGNGVIGQWGNDIVPAQPPVLPALPVIQPSEKVLGRDNTYYPSREQRQGRDIATQQPTRFAAGGLLPEQEDPKKKKDTSPMFGPWSMNQIGNALYSGATKLANITQGRGDSNVRTSQPVAPVAATPVAPQATSSRSIPTGRKPIGTSTSVGRSGQARRTKPSVTGITPSTGDKFPAINRPDTGLPVLPELNVSDQANIVDAVTTTVTQPAVNTQAGGPPAQLGSNKRRNMMGSVVDGINKITPFISNLNNAATKLPLPPTPILDDEISPSTVDYSASRAEAVRANRGANKAVDQGLSSGAASTAARAANLSQQVRSVGQINEAEQNTNTSIRNQAAQVNAGIRANNNAKKANYQNELVSRTLKGQELRSQNLANVEEKIQGMSRDKKLFDLEDQKVMLEALKDDTGASFRGARAIFAKHLSPESLEELDLQYAAREKDNAEDRKAARASGQLALNYIKRNKAAVEDDDKTLPQVLGKLPTVTTAKEDDARNKSRRKK